MNMFYIRQPMNTGVISNYHYSQNLYQVTNIYMCYIRQQRNTGMISSNQLTQVLHVQ